jgi:hypothetical protein
VCVNVVVATERLPFISDVLSSNARTSVNALSSPGTMRGREDFTPETQPFVDDNDNVFSRT